MATVLYLNDTQVYPDGSQSIKLTKENPYFTQSDSYTLDVTLPMDILENRTFFKNINRLVKSKSVERMSCRLLADNRLLLAGSAKITQVTDKEVKVQLLGGNSEVNFLSEDEGNYIDKLELGKIIKTQRSHQAGDYDYRVDTGIKCKEVTINNETTEGTQSRFQFGLIDITKRIFSVLGFTITECSIDKTPWNEIYVASAKNTLNVSHVLPHWSLKTFIEEFCKFFNVSVVINQEYKTVRIVDNPSFFDRSDSVVIEAIDEYTAEMNEDTDAHALAADNLRFDLSGSEHHDYDMIPDNVRDNAETEEFASRTAAYNAWSAASEDDKKNKIYACPTGRYTGWLHDFSDVGGSEETLQFTQIDIFAPLVRNPDTDNETELKICPVAFGEIDYQSSFTTQGGIEHSSRYRAHLPSMENPSGDDIKHGRTFGASRTSSGSSTETDSDDATIQDYILGEAEIEKGEKEDRLQVMFIDDTPQPVFSWNNTFGDSESQAITGFTDYQFKKAHKGQTHELWSLSLNDCEATYYLGQLHKNGFSFNLEAKLCVKFLSKEIPSPTKVFIIQNKCYGCEKIEAQIDNLGIQQLMTGYFYEML